MSSIAESKSIASPPSMRDLRAAQRARARAIDRVVTYGLWALATGIVALLAYFILYTLFTGIGVISWKFITSSDIAGDYVGPEVFNTFYILILALVLCVPVGIGAAVYLVEYAQQGRFTTVLRFATETLAGIPSIVLGFFGFLIFVTALGQNAPVCTPSALPLHLCYHGFSFSRVAGALTLAILNLPLIVRISEDAIRSVPNELREASAALGATKSQTIARVLLPTSLPQFTTGVILTAGKMIGETAALLLTTGGSSPVNGWFTLNPFFPGDTLTVHLYEIRAEGITRNAHLVANGTATLLIVLLLVFNLGLRGLSGLLNQRLQGRRS